MENTPSLSLLMTTRPGEFECVMEQVLNVAGTAVLSSSEEGKILLTVVADNCEVLNKRVDILQFVEGLQSSLVTYH